MFDYIVVGAGSAGCVVADRLSEDGGSSVLLIEAGPRDNSPFIHMPVGFYRLTGGALTWGYETVPQRQANNRRIPFSQGRVLGGSSSINGMVYTRGNPADYDRWAVAGCGGWTYAEVLPDFKRAEDNNRLFNDFHGSGGPLGVSDPVHTHRLSRLFVKAAQQRGIAYNSDFNGAIQEGCGLYQINARDGRRSSAAAAYLSRASGRKNLQIATGTLVTRVQIERGRAVGVEYVTGGRSQSARANREVILSAGAFGSPKLLMLSGIGPADHLRSLGMPVVVDSPSVGRNLQDHVDVDTIYELKQINSYDVYRAPFMKMKAALEYFVFGGGPVSSNIVEAGAFWYSADSAATPDLQLHFLPGAGIEESTPSAARGSGCTLNSYFLRPRSRGSVRLQSSDPRIPPLIDPNYWDDPYDLDRSLDGLLLSREIMAQPILREFIAGEQLPGATVKSREQLIAFLKAYGRTAYHPIGTCRMGDDELAVVDPKLRVRGVDHLRVIDASIMPSIISSNTNAATMMIAERASEFICGRGLGDEQLRHSSSERETRGPCQEATDNVNSGSVP